MTEPVTVGDLLTIGVDRIRRPATVADLVSALRAEGVVVVSEATTYELIQAIEAQGWLVPPLQDASR